MELVWTNLLSNAFKFTEAGGTVTLAESATEEGVVVRVSDTGCGMDEATRARVFEKFYQGDTSHATEGQRPGAGAGKARAGDDGLPNRRGKRPGPGHDIHSDHSAKMRVSKMNQAEKKTFVANDYKEAVVERAQLSQYLDGYECFGWQAEREPESAGGDMVSSL